MIFASGGVQVGLRKGSKIDIEARAGKKMLKSMFERAPRGLRRRKKVVWELLGAILGLRGPDEGEQKTNYVAGRALGEPL